MEMWGRLIRVTVSGKGGSAVFRGEQSPGPGLQIRFSVKKTIGSKQNSGTIVLVNLSKSRRNQLGDEFDQIHLEAGYKDGGYATICKADIRDVKHTKTSPDIESTVEFGDGDKAVSKGKASKTFPSGSKPKDIIEYLQKQLPGVAKGDVKGLDDLPKTKRPVTLFGNPARELDEQGRQHKFYWSIQDGKFQTMKADGHLGGNILISVETGMIGTAEPTDKGVNVKCLLNPAILPGKTIDVRSDFLDQSSGRDKRASDAGGGIFRVSSVTYEGDSRGDSFYCDIEADRVQGGKVTQKSSGKGKASAKKGKS